ncbi:MAG: hypothetical protein ACFWTZ_09850 [Burkholderia sp.]
MKKAAFVILLAALAPAGAFSAQLPAELAAAAAELGVNPRAVAFSVVDLSGARASGGGAPQGVRTIAAWRDAESISPASTAKLVTTLSALELLGPDYRWRTRFLAPAAPSAKGEVSALYLAGGGDPAFDANALREEARRLRRLGVKKIAGDLIVDRSAFNPAPGDPGDFDGRPDRPYNQLPDAALVNARSLIFDIVPDPASGRARVFYEPELEGVSVQAAVPLAKGACGDWREALAWDISEGRNRTVRFGGALAGSCGEKVLSVVPMAADEYLGRLFARIWREEGGEWTGRAREGRTPEGAVLLSEHRSIPLSEAIVRINKWSNNQMARHVFLTVGSLADGKNKDGVPQGASERDARARIAAWLSQKGVDAGSVSLENGSGLSRRTRVTARAMTQLLAAGWTSPYMPEFAASLPIAGVDGTMRRRKSSEGKAHIKTGYLADARAAGGYIEAESGRRYAIFACVEGEENGLGATRFIDRLIAWARKQP